MRYLKTDHLKGRQIPACMLIQDTRISRVLLQIWLQRPTKGTLPKSRNIEGQDKIVIFLSSIALRKKVLFGMNFSVFWIFQTTLFFYKNCFINNQTNQSSTDFNSMFMNQSLVQLQKMGSPENMQALSTFLALFCQGIKQLKFKRVQHSSCHFQSINQKCCILTVLSYQKYSKKIIQKKFSAFSKISCPIDSSNPFGKYVGVNSLQAITILLEEMSFLSTQCSQLYLGQCDLSGGVLWT